MGPVLRTKANRGTEVGWFGVEGALGEVAHVVGGGWRGDASASLQLSVGHRPQRPRRKRNEDSDVGRRSRPAVRDGGFMAGGWARRGCAFLKYSRTRYSFTRSADEEGAGRHS